MSKNTDFHLNRDGFVVWGTTGERVKEEEVGSMSEVQSASFARTALSAFSQEPDIDKNYRPW